MAPAVATGAFALTLALAAASCGAGSGQARTPAGPSGPAISVVASNFPIANLVAGVGGSHVRVTDLSQGAPDGRTIVPTPVQEAAIGRAAVVVDVGEGYQPAVEAAIARSGASPTGASPTGASPTGAHPRLLSLVTALQASNPHFWLDPPTMAKAANLVAGALEAVDPAARAAYRQSATDVTDSLNSLQIDFQSSLSDCPHTLLVVPDNAFAALAGRVGLHLVVLPPTAGPPEVARVAAQVRATALPTVFSQPPVGDGPLSELARTTHTALHALDTLDGPPPDARLANADYTARMETNLRVLAGGLYCSSSGNP